MIAGDLLDFVLLLLFCLLLMLEMFGFVVLCTRDDDDNDREDNSSALREPANFFVAVEASMLPLTELSDVRMATNCHRCSW